MTTKDTIRQLGKSLLQKRGYNAFSFADISVPLGVKNAAIHYHYPTKESLGVDILRDEYERFQQWKTLVVSGQLTYETQLEQFFKIYEDSLDMELSICLIGSVATDFNTVPDGMKDDLNKLVYDISEWLTSMLSKAKQEGTFIFNGAADGMAFSIISSLAGSLQLSRVKGPDLFYAVTQNIRIQLGINEGSETSASIDQ